MPSKATPAVTDDAIRTRAYLMWEADGQPHGRDDHYWGLAHAELSAPVAEPKRAAATAKAPEKKSAVKAKPAAKAAAKKPAAKAAAKPKKK